MKYMLKLKLSLVFILLSSAIFAQKKTQNFTVTRVIDQNASAVWKVVGEDYGAVANSHPGIVSSNYIDGSLKGGEGVERVCNFNEKGTKFTHEKQVEFDPVNFSFKAQVFTAEGIPMDSDYTYAIYKVKAINDTSCELSIEMVIRTKPAFLGSLAKGKFKKTIEDYALAVEHHVKTGESVTKENFKEIKKSYKS